MNTNFSNLDLVTSFDLSNSGTAEKPVYQFIYGSQLYGTLFGIYGRFKITTLGEGKACKIDELTLTLLNYRGVVNVGFTTHAPHYKPFDGESRIYFGVRGASMERVKTMSFPADLILKKGDPFRLIFCGILYPLPDFSLDTVDSATLGKPLGLPIPNSPLF